MGEMNCIKCKGSNPRFYCARSYCPIIAKSEAQFKISKITKSEINGSSPTPFVGRYGYPNVQAGILSVEQKDSQIYDAPRLWAKSDYNIQKVIDLRSSLVNSRFKINIKQQSKFLEISQEVGMASKPVELEVQLKKKPEFRLKTDPYAAPTGPNADLKKVQITSNPKIHHKVDRVVNDTDLKSTKSLIYLYKNNFDENFLTKLLSIGTLGIKKHRKLVPTRWSITAVDDILGKQLISQIKDFSEYEYAAYFGDYLGNYYLILTFPEIWSYELFEMYMPKVSWNTSEEIQSSTDYENYGGRKNYAENCAGGYYAARLPILEKLKSLKRQSSVLAIRFITGDYYLPLGVWVVREATRKTLSTKPLIFESKELLLKYATAFVKKKFRYNLDNLTSKSILLKEMRTQRKLTAY